MGWGTLWETCRSDGRARYGGPTTLHQYGGAGRKLTPHISRDDSSYLLNSPPDGMLFIAEHAISNNVPSPHRDSILAPPLSPDFSFTTSLSISVFKFIPSLLSSKPSSRLGTPILCPVITSHTLTKPLDKPSIR